MVFKELGADDDFSNEVLHIFADLLVIASDDFITTTVVTKAMTKGDMNINGQFGIHGE